MAKKRLNFVVSVGESVSLSAKGKSSLAAAVGAAAAAELARTDQRRGVVFIPRIDWPGGRIVDLSRILSRDQLREVDPDGAPG